MIPGNDRVERFDGSGDYLGQFGSAGSGKAEFDTPVGIAFVRNERGVYVVELRERSR